MVASRPSGPEGLPVLGNTLQFVRGRESFYEDAATYGVRKTRRFSCQPERRSGDDIVSLDVLGLGEHYMASEPDLVEGMLVSDRDRFAKPSQTKEQLGELLGQGSS